MTGSDLQVDSTEPLLGTSRRGRVDSFLSRSIGARMSSLRRTKIARLARYATTSGVAFGVSEATLLILYGSGVVNATVAAVFANLAGTVPSYLMSHYWIWRDAPRTRMARQVALYWATSISCIALTSLSTGAIVSLAPSGHRSHLAVIAVGFPVVMISFWFAKFVDYQRVIFQTTRPRHDSTTATQLGGRLAHDLVIAPRQRSVDQVRLNAPTPSRSTRPNSWMPVLRDRQGSTRPSAPICSGKA